MGSAIYKIKNATSVHHLKNQYGSLHKTTEDYLADVDQLSQEEALTKRRPESDYLRLLKNQTEDKLATFKTLECIPTKQAEEAKKLLERKRSIVIKGNPGEGKTTTALQVIDIEMYRDRRVVLYCPQDWEAVDTDCVDIVVLEDVFGQFDLDPGCLQKWMVYLPTIQENVDAGKLQVIVTSRVDILSKAYSKLGSIKLFSDDLSLTLCSEKLTNSEKMSILNRELCRHKRSMKDDEKEKCIYNFTGLISFPQCCSLYAGDRESFHRGPEFFGSPKKFFVESITKLGVTRFLSLAFLFCNGKIWEENLSPETMPETSKYLLMELASHLHISNKKASITLLRDAYDSFLGLYIMKFNFSFQSIVKKSCIWFTHAAVFEAVGQILGDHCPEMIVKYGDSEYLYQRTYTAEAKDSTAGNVFIPVSVYGLLAERMVHDVLKRGLVRSVVKHSALKRHDFLRKLKCELHKGNEIKDFFMTGYYFGSVFGHDLSEGECITFIQYILQSDEDVVRSVYTQFLEFLACPHKNNSSNCWQCGEKQKLLELALYYHHFQIADKLITMKACYTNVSLCNAAKHGDLGRSQTILETLKRSQVFNPRCEEARKAFCRAYISGNQSLIGLFLKEGIILDSSDDASKALENAYKSQKYDVCDLLVQEGVSLKMNSLPVKVCCVSMKTIKKAIQHLKNTDNWDPECDDASKALENAYTHLRYDVCDLLVQEGVSLTMKNLLIVTGEFQVSMKTIKKAIQHLKDTDNWDPKCDDASKTLENAYQHQRYDLCELLVQEGVSLTMKNLPVMVYCVSLETVKKEIQHLKDTDNWDPKCDDTSKVLENAYQHQRYDVCDLLVQEGVSLKMKSFPVMVCCVSMKTIKKAIQHLKDTDNWNPKCDDASKALENAYKLEKYDLCELLVQEGVSLKMKSLAVMVYCVSMKTIKKAIQHLKDTDIWDPKCDDAFEALAKAYNEQKYDVCDLLFQEGVSLTTKNLPAITLVPLVSLESVVRAIQHLKDTDNWNPKCDDASEALAKAYNEKNYDVCELLVQEGVSLTMKNLPGVVCSVSLESAKKTIQYLKDTGNWDPKCDYAYEALVNAYSEQKNDVCDLLVVEGVTLTMKHLPGVLYSESLESVKQTIQHMKDTDNWDPKCDDASKALEIACTQQKYDVCDLLVRDGVSLSMKHLPRVLHIVSLKGIKKVIQLLKDTDSWDPECEDATKALANAFSEQEYDVCDMLVQEGVTLTMKNLPGLMMLYSVSLKSVKKVIQHLKKVGCWAPKSDYASKALANVYSHQKYDVCDLLVQDGVSLSMKHLPHVLHVVSLEGVKKSIQHLKDTENWDPKCDDASKALENAYSEQRYDVCDLLVQEGVSLTMKNLPGMVLLGSLESVKKAIQHLKDTKTWNSSSHYAEYVLAVANFLGKIHVCDVLISEKVYHPELDEETIYKFFQEQMK